jgi:glycosyltransferase involved in cell wall biosynthesis
MSLIVYKGALVMSKRLMIITRVAAHFRRGLYEELAKLFDLKIVSGSVRTNEGIKEIFEIIGGDHVKVKYIYLPFGFFISFESIFLVWRNPVEKILLTPTSRDLGLPFILLIAYFRKIPVYGYAMGNMPGKSALRTYIDKQPLKILFYFLKKILCYSTVAEKYYSSLTSKPCITVYNSNLTLTDLQKITSLKHKPENNMTIKGQVCFLGRLVPGKNIQQLCRLIMELGDEYTLEVIGDGPLLPVLKQEFGGQSQINFRGFLERESAWKVLVKSEIFVLPGLGGLAIQEAIACDCFVICSEGDGTEKDLITNNVNGSFFEVNNFNDLKEKLILTKGRNLKSSKIRSFNKATLERHNVEALALRFLKELDT